MAIFCLQSGWVKKKLLFSDVAQIQVFAPQHASETYHQQGDKDDDDDANDVDDNDMKMTFFQVKSGRELEKQLRRFQEVEEIKTFFGKIKYQFWSIEHFVLKVKYD